MTNIGDPWGSSSLWDDGIVHPDDEDLPVHERRTTSSPWKKI